ncbi:MAG: nucleoside kinase, partial [Clostridiales bacterium]|nr:nucleoside kinase [Clostridiales bacterium]
MAFELSYINERISTDPVGFVEECEARYHDKVALAARMIAENVKLSPLVLLSGPSGSGKTTTAQKVTEALSLLGINSRSIALDHYFIPRTEANLPLTPEGDPDYESPRCIDWSLLNSHFDELETGREIIIPYFSFVRQSRDESKAKPLCVKSDEVIIFEGIHALNSLITSSQPEAFRLYVSARSDTYDGDKLVFKGTWKR